ncbi:MAG: DUF2946 family protein [Telluria sp.]
MSATMSRQSFFRVLLSLLLLVSQQMAFAHGLTHLTGQLHEPGAQQHQNGDSSLSAAVAQDQSCDHCLALAQLGAPLGSANRTFVAGDNGATAFSSTPAGAHCARTPCGFNPRAPPQA